jgi:hypothetical protein
MHLLKGLLNKSFAYLWSDTITFSFFNILFCLYGVVTIRGIGMKSMFLPEWWLSSKF